MAVLDVRLKDEECVSVAERLVLMGVPFVVHSGVPPAECDVAFAYGKFIAKPADPQEIVALVRSMIAADLMNWPAPLGGRGKIACIGRRPGGLGSAAFG
jgi:hypothetical protein